jgi:hypothetical protein
MKMRLSLSLWRLRKVLLRWVHDEILDSRLRGNDGQVEVVGTEVSFDGIAASRCPGAKQSSCTSFASLLALFLNGP